ncbi:uncharacterized protein BDW43DRAFT_321109 [Aspergillus alliaceus]|uniref:uncharacterized protein n=1 Tax=Petromyces alliaceus TaxID=209559 RepID=UPI0012A55EB7|nr:uncharacterized protein BDW43DRAFT_321109 [Aspergillus alliaceus]KAB8237922.1 hypothetical protein BDW43DRAFT_321109 [Aspergillus alliaceus]
MNSFTHDDYTIAWICALSLEVAAARTSADPNAYEVGELNGHCIVIACLPAGVYGTVSAATVVSRMCLTFPRLQYGLMVGIGGGVPGNNNDIRLGDVVVSKPVGKYIQGGQFESTGTLNKPPQAFLTHMGQLEAKTMTEGKHTLSKIVERFSPPEQHMDFLFHSSYHHATKEDTCGKCDKEQLIKRQPRDTRTPYIHYGLIASGDQVIKDSETRDRLAQQYGILCFEMEAAGFMDELPTLQKEWQGYAALTAAAYTKLLLSVIPVCRTECGSLKRNSMQHWMVSLEKNPRFVGREDEILKLEEFLTMQDGPRRIAITGLGGVGKTQVALEVVYRIRSQDKECSIFWVPCTSYSMIEQAFLNIAQKLGIHNIKPAEVKEQIKLYLSSKRAGKWLLIFDNADDTEMWLTTNNTAPALEDFLPQSEQGHIIFTTRNGELAVELTSSNIISIPDVDKETAWNILESLLLNKALLKDHIITATLLEQLAFLPLAIAQASAYINKKRLSLSAYSTLLQEEEQEAVELLSEDFRDPGRYKDIQNPVITTWLISFKQIQRQSQAAADYLSFIGCINPRNIPQSLLPLQSTKKQRLDALGLLNAYSFTSSQGTDISMHRLVHIATRNWLRKQRVFSHWVHRVAGQMDIVFPDNHHNNRGLWREYLPHALALAYENEFIIQQEQYLHLIEKIADCLGSDGRYHEAEVLYNRLISINQEKNGQEHPSTLISMADLASTYRNQGRWNEAEKLQAQVMETSKIGRWDEAEELEVQVMETRKTVLGAEHPGTLTSMANLAYTWESQGKLHDAMALMENCSELRSKVLGPNHPDARASSHTLSHWKHEHISNRTPEPAPSQIACSPYVPEISTGNAETTIATQLSHQEYVKPLPPQRQSANPFLRSQFLSHPLIILSRANSPASGHQHLQEVD